jgi:hypothetical protein
MKVYTIGGRSCPIKAVEVLRKTDKFVYFSGGSRNNPKENRQAIKSVYGTNYFLSWEEAYEYLLQNALNKVEVAERSVNNAHEWLKLVQLLIKPEDKP